MTIAFSLYHFFPYGGLQRDFLRIANHCQKLGCKIRVYTTCWQGEHPNDFDIQLLTAQGITNHGKMTSFYKQVKGSLIEQSDILLIGFNKMPGLDVYYAADTCYKAKSEKKSFFYKLSPRYRYYSAFEEAVFSKESKTICLLISALQKPIFQHYYQTPEERLYLLPPGISKDRCRSTEADNIRATFRQDFNLDVNERLVLMVGSGFKTKGLDRALKSIASLPEKLRIATRFFVIGQDNPKPFLALASKLGISGNIKFFSGRDDIPRFLQSADLLIHPAYNENTGTILLESMVAGLPVLTTDVCGYSHYILDANAGIVIKSPFKQEALNKATKDMLLSNKLKEWSNNGVTFSKTADLFSLPQRAAEIIISQAEEKNRQRKLAKWST